MSIFNSGVCCNMVSINYHQYIADKLSDIMVDFTNLEDSQYETLNILGIQGGT